MQGLVGEKPWLLIQPQVLRSKASNRAIITQHNSRATLHSELGLAMPSRALHINNPIGCADDLIALPDSASSRIGQRRKGKTSADLGGGVFSLPTKTKQLAQAPFPQNRNTNHMRCVQL